MGLMPEFSTDFGYNVAIEIPFSAELSMKKKSFIFSGPDLIVYTSICPLF